MKSSHRLIFGLALAATASLHAADFHVAERCGDANPGRSIEQPFLTLQHADSVVTPAGKA